MSKAPSMLLDTHPRIGDAAFIAYWEADRTELWNGQRVSEVIHHDYRRAACEHCGALERRHVVKDRLLVGPNAGIILTHYWQRKTCVHGSVLSNYRVPWARPI